MDRYIDPHSVRGINGTIGETLRSHKNKFVDGGNRTTPAWLYGMRIILLVSLEYVSICHQGLEPASVRLIIEGPGIFVGTVRFDMAIPGIEPTVRFDICEGASFYQSCFLGKEDCADR